MIVKAALPVNGNQGLKSVLELSPGSLKKGDAAGLEVEDLAVFVMNPGDPGVAPGGWRGSLAIVGVFDALALAIDPDHEVSQRVQQIIAPSIPAGPTGR